MKREKKVKAVCVYSDCTLGLTQLLFIWGPCLAMLRGYSCLIAWGSRDHTVIDQTIDCSFLSMRVFGPQSFKIEIEKKMRGLHPLVFRADFVFRDYSWQCLEDRPYGCQGYRIQVCLMQCKVPYYCTTCSGHRKNFLGTNHNRTTKISTKITY